MVTVKLMALPREIVLFAYRNGFEDDKKDNLQLFLILSMFGDSDFKGFFNVYSHYLIIESSENTEIFNHFKTLVIHQKSA